MSVRDELPLRTRIQELERLATLPNVVKQVHHLLRGDDHGRSEMPRVCVFH